MTATTTPSEAAGHEKQFLGQPRVLSNLFGVEMWERFSFYGMQGILLIYLYYSVAQGGLGIDKATASGTVGAYGGAVYLATGICPCRGCSRSTRCSSSCWPASSRRCGPSSVTGSRRAR